MNVKVIATSFRKGREVRVGDRHVFPTHQQDYPTSESVLEMLKNVVEEEIKTDSGAVMDTILVNNDCGFIEGNEYIESINGTKTKNGKIISYTRPDRGWSFGAYSDAYLKYRDDYGFWLFTEDDIVVSGDLYYKKLLDRWREIEGVKVPIGFLSLVGVIRHSYGIHCGGGVGFTSRAILEKLVEKHGKLPHYEKCDDENESLSQNRQRIILQGEVAFTNAIDTLGYILLDYGENKSWNLSKNLCIPYLDFKHA